MAKTFKSSLYKKKISFLVDGELEPFIGECVGVIQDVGEVYYYLIKFEDGSIHRYHLHSLSRIQILSDLSYMVDKCAPVISLCNYRRERAKA